MLSHADRSLSEAFGRDVWEESSGVMFLEQVAFAVSVEENPLAFDHAKIIATAFMRLLAFDLKRLAFFFLPDEFSLTNYIDVYQYLTRNSIDQSNIPNFRRQLTATKTPLLVPVEGKFEDEGKGHVKAQLYRRNIEGGM